MKTLFLGFLLLSIIILNGCGTDTGGKNCSSYKNCDSRYCNLEINKCETKECDEWETLSNGVCELKDGKCAIHGDC